MNLLDRLVTAIAPPDLYALPLKVRRAFVLTLPLSGPLWLLCGMVWVCAVALGGVALMVLVMAAWLVTPIIHPLFVLWDITADLWASDGCEPEAQGVNPHKASTANPAVSNGLNQ